MPAQSRVEFAIATVIYPLSSLASRRTHHCLQPDSPVALVEGALTEGFEVFVVSLPRQQVPGGILKCTNSGSARRPAVTAVTALSTKKYEYQSWARFSRRIIVLPSCRG